MANTYGGVSVAEITNDSNLYYIGSKVYKGYVPGNKIYLRWKGVAGDLSESYISKTRITVRYSDSQTPIITRDVPYLINNYNSTNITVLLRKTLIIRFQYILINETPYDVWQQNLTVYSNEKPDLLTVTTTTYTITTGQYVRFNYTYTNPSDGDSITLYYSSNSGGSYSSYPSSGIYVSQTTDLYFKTWDGFQLSEDTIEVTITRGYTPTITSMSVTTPTYQARPGSSYNFSIGFSNRITSLQINTNTTCTLYIDICYEYNDKTNTSFSQSGSYRFVTKTSISSYTLSSGIYFYKDLFDKITSVNLRDKINSGNDIRWQLKITLTNDTGSSVYYYPSGSGSYSTSSSYFYTISRAPKITTYYNQRGYNYDIPGTNGKIYRNVRLKIEYDESVWNSHQLEIKNSSGNTISTSGTTSYSSVSGGYVFIDITLSNSPPDSYVTFTVKNKDYYNGTVYITKLSTYEVYTTKVPDFGTFSLNFSTLQAFEPGKTVTMQSKWPFGTYTSVTSSVLSQYNCDSYVIVKMKDSNGNIESFVPSLNTWARSNDYMVANIQDRLFTDGSFYFSSSYSTNPQGYYGDKTFQIYLSITNLFGVQFVSSTKQLTINFDTPPIIEEADKIYWSTSRSGPWTVFSSSSKIQEGMYLRFQFPVQYYTSENRYNYLRLSNNSGESTVGQQYGGYSPGYWQQGSAKTTSGTIPSPYQTHISMLYGPCSQLIEDNVRKWRLRSLGDRNIHQQYTDYTNTQVLTQGPPTIENFTCVLPNDDDITTFLNYTFTVSSTGFSSGSIFYDLGNSYDIMTMNHIQPASTIAPATLKQDYQQWDSMPVYLVCTSTVTGLVTNTKQYRIGPIYLYKLVPTVAYRPGQIGINTKNTRDGVVVLVKPSQNGQKVVITGLNTSGSQTEFKIDPQDGTVSYYVNDILKHKLNLLSGTIT